MMNNDLRPYDEYSETGINWIENIPSTWKIAKNSVLFREIVDTGHSELELLSILQNKGIVKQSSTGRKIRKAEENQSYKRICKGDIGYNLMNAFMGAIGASKYEGIISPAYAVCRPKININVWYYHYLFRTELYKSEFNKNSYGIMYERNRLYFDRFKNIYAIIPPRPEQDQIVKYLDHKLSKINKFIKAKKKLISVLEEQKQVIINEVVTKGLDPNVRGRPSGVDWIGDVPEHWSNVRLRFLCSIKTGDKDTINRVDNGRYPFYVRSPHVERIDTYTFDGEAILTAGDGVGAGKVFHYANGKFDYHQRVYNLHNIKSILPEYLYYYLKTNFYKEIEKGNAKSTVDSIRLPMLKNFQILFGDYDEQEAILNYIKANEKYFDDSIASIKKELDLILEYKTTLISDVVTGKVDVRHIEVDETEEEIIEETDFDDISIDENAGETEGSDD